MKRYFIGESCLCWSMGSLIDPTISRQILAAYKALRRLQAGGTFPVLDVVPCYHALAVYFDPATADLAKIQECAEAALQAASGATAAPGDGKTLTIPVLYVGEDLGRVADLTQRSTDAVIAGHSGAHYTVAMIGFLPHFPYLMGLPDELAAPRLDSPRQRVPAGSVVIAGTQAGVYPEDAPGGWNIIGTTDPELLRTLEPGDTVRFTPA